MESTVEPAMESTVEPPDGRSRADRRCGVRMTLLSRVLIPVASEEDAAETAAALAPHLEDVDHVVAVHVIEKAGGAIDKAPLEKREEDAEAMLRLVRELLGEDVAVETEVAYDTDVVDAIFETADEVDATAIAFTAREGGRLARLLSGDTSGRLVTEAPIPVVALPKGE